MSDITEALDKLKGEFEGQFKAANDAAIAEREKLGAETAETKQAVERIQDALDELEGKIEAARVADVKAREAGADGPEAMERKAAFREFVKTGVETKGMIVRDDTEGGFLAPVEFVNSLVTGIVEFSPMREVAEVIRTSRRAIQRPKRTGLATATWVGETETRPETGTPTLGLDEIPTHEMSAKVLISQADIEDTAFDIEGWVKSEMSEAFGTTEATAFLYGSGAKKPHGLMANADFERIPLGAAAAIDDADGLIDLAYALKSGYSRNASWMMKRSVVRDIRKLKDGNGDYLWQPGITGLAPAMILGHPYREAPDMPDVAADAEVIAFGDFRRAYTIVDRLVLAMMNDPYTEADNGMIVIRARKRVGGQVRLPEAVKIGKVATA